MAQTVDVSPEAARYLPLVKSIALQVKKKLPAHIELDDLIGYGSIGLMEAIGSFRTGQGTTFKTFAYYRIRGAIYDGLRKIGWLSRSAYAEHKFNQKANELVLSHANSAEGIVKRSVEAEVVELKQVLQTLVPVCLLSMESVDRLLHDEKSESPEASLLEKQTTEMLQSAIQNLDERERLLVQYYYFDDLTLEAAAEKLNISKSWASRLHFKVLSKIKNGMTGKKRVA
jgi:RNA polymerase sigma factor for flagellar operon FliA